MNKMVVVKVISYIALGVFILTHLIWQYLMYRELRKIKTKYFFSINDQIKKLKAESDLPDSFYLKISTIRRISRISIGIYLVIFCYMMIRNLSG